MNTHKTDVIIPKEAMNLGNSPIEFKVRQGTKNLGTLKVAKANIQWWRPNANQATKKMKWADFIRLVTDE